jgi:hypothetical protein
VQLLVIAGVGVLAALIVGLAAPLAIRLGRAIQPGQQGRPKTRGPMQPLEPEHMATSDRHAAYLS